jgi:hypothetical protein
VSKYLSMIESVDVAAPAVAEPAHTLDAPPATAAEAPIFETSVAKSLIRICLEHGVGLRLDPDGALVVVSNGKAWRSLVNAIEAHVDAIAALVAAGWNGDA